MSFMCIFMYRIYYYHVLYSNIFENEIVARQWRRKNSNKGSIQSAHNKQIEMAIRLRKRLHCDLLRKRREKTCKDQYFEAFDVYHSCHTVHFIVFSIRWFLSLQIFSLSQTIYCSFLWSHTLSFSISGVLYNHLAAVHVTANRTDSFYVLHFLGIGFEWDVIRISKKSIR